ncbi:Mitochondria-eating protein [Intoshia linei]|uniref:Mitochondria-eating protein n=1 Tax=Intoshia linei TaxID=1819745 RepID=A0A177B6K5_9BILA|nr:Mitochondria-eating protein [Intoshia linei]
MSIKSDIAALDNINSFMVLVRKLRQWKHMYNSNTIRDNLYQGSELFELNARLQNQIYNIIERISIHGNLQVPYTTKDLHKSRDLYSELKHENKINKLSSSLYKKDDLISSLKSQYELEISHLENKMRKLDTDLSSTQLVTRMELDRKEREIDNIKNESRVHTQELQKLKTQNLKDSIYKNEVKNIGHKLQTLSSQPANYDSSYITESHTLPRSTLNSSYRKIVSFSETENKINALKNQFDDLNSIFRQSAFDNMREYISNKEKRDCILYQVIKESFRSAQLRLPEYKLSTRDKLAIVGVSSLDLTEQTQQYIEKNSELYDHNILINDVISSLTRNIDLYLTSSTISVIRTYVRETCKFAWNCTVLANPLTLSLSSQWELFDDYKYRRSVDSEYSSPLVQCHIWPCLMMGMQKITKGVVKTGHRTSRII